MQPVGRGLDIAALVFSPNIRNAKKVAKLQLLYGTLVIQQHFAIHSTAQSFAVIQRRRTEESLDKMFHQFDHGLKKTKTIFTHKRPNIC